MGGTRHQKLVEGISSDLTTLMELAKPSSLRERFPNKKERQKKEKELADVLDQLNISMIRLLMNPKLSFTDEDREEFRKKIIGACGSDFYTMAMANIHKSSTIGIINSEIATLIINLFLHIKTFLYSLLYKMWEDSQFNYYVKDNPLFPLFLNCASITDELARFIDEEIIEFKPPRNQNMEEIMGTYSSIESSMLRIARDQEHSEVIENDIFIKFYAKQLADILSKEDNSLSVSPQDFVMNSTKNNMFWFIHHLEFILERMVRGANSLFRTDTNMILIPFLAEYINIASEICTIIENFKSKNKNCELDDFDNFHIKERIARLRQKLGLDGSNMRFIPASSDESN